MSFSAVDPPKIIEQKSTNIQNIQLQSNSRSGNGRRLIRKQVQLQNTQTQLQLSNQSSSNKHQHKEQFSKQNEITIQVITPLLKEPTILIDQTITKPNDYLGDEQIKNMIGDSVNNTEKHSDIGNSRQLEKGSDIILLQKTNSVTHLQSPTTSQLFNSSVIENNVSINQSSSSNMGPIIYSKTNSIKAIDNNEELIVEQVKQSRAQVINQEKQEIKYCDNLQDSIKKVGLKCSILQLALTDQQINSLKFVISHLTQSFTNQDWNCPTLSSYPLSHAAISPIKYFGFSETDITQKTNNNGINISQQQKYNRQLLLGTKSKLKREIVQESNAQKLHQKKCLFLYVEEGLTPITKSSLIIQEKSSSNINFMHQIDFQQRLNIVIDILQIFALLHNLNFTLFPHILFPTEIQNSILFTKNNQFNHQYQPHLKLSVHLLECFKQHLGNSTKKFNLKEFISLMLELGQNDKRQSSFKSQLSKDLRSPQIRFYHQEWYWKLWNKLFAEYVQNQTEKTYLSDLVTPTWIDLFEVSFGCLKFLYSEQFIEKLIQRKYDEIKKSVQKLISNQKTKKQQNFQDQVIKVCQKPLIQWNEYEKFFKQSQEKVKKPQENKKSATTIITRSKQKDLMGTILTHSESRKVFEQLISYLGFFPINKLAKQKYQAKRSFTLSMLHQRLKKFKSTNKKSSQIVPVLIKSRNLSKSINQQNGQKNKISSSQRSLTLLGSDEKQTELIELKRKYIELLSSTNTLSKEQFQAQYVKKPETHILTPQIKKKLNTVFSTHNGIMKIPKSFTLAYKSSVFNFSARKFYECCENKPCLLYVMKIKNDKTLFYFNEEQINRARQLNGLFCGFIKDLKETSFIYTGDQVLKVKNPTKSFGVSHIHGPIIGEGDIIIKQGSIQNEYNHPRSYQAAKKSKKLLKTPRFELQQMDIYELKF